MSKERTPQERETLMFATREQAKEFGERVAERMRKQESPGMKRRRDTVKDAVADEMAAAGHPAGVITHPWEHTEEEHEEAQTLVDMAFAKDLGTALRRAEKSEHYPRVLDLFHDVLTNEMYPLLVQHKLNRQPLAGWVLLGTGAAAVAVLLLLFGIIFL